MDQEQGMATFQKEGLVSKVDQKKKKDEFGQYRCGKEERDYKFKAETAQGWYIRGRIHEQEKSSKKDHRHGSTPSEGPVPLRQSLDTARRPQAGEDSPFPRNAQIVPDVTSFLRINRTLIRKECLRKKTTLRKKKDSDRTCASCARP